MGAKSVAFTNIFVKPANLPPQKTHVTRQPYNISSLLLSILCDVTESAFEDASKTII